MNFYTSPYQYLEISIAAAETTECTVIIITTIINISTLLIRPINFGCVIINNRGQRFLCVGLYIICKHHSIMETTPPPIDNLIDS